MKRLLGLVTSFSVLLGTALATSCSSEADCRDTATCACTFDTECSFLPVEQCQVATCRGGACGVVAVPAGTACDAGSCDAVGNCVPDTSGAGGTGAGGTGSGAGGSGGSAPVFEEGRQLAAGGGFTCAIVDGAVKCWGFNQTGEVGVGTIDSPIIAPTEVALPRPALEVSAGGRHVCARLDDGSVWCWGQNSQGQLGDGTFQLKREPVEVDLPKPAVQVSARGRSSFALHPDGTVSSWGDKVTLGTGNATVDSSVPVQVAL